MILCTDGTRFNGKLEAGQVWVKGSRERVIYDFNSVYMYYQDKTGLRNGVVTGVPRSTFRKWIMSGAKLKVEKKVVECSRCQEELELKEHINICECGSRVKVLH